MRKNYSTKLLTLLIFTICVQLIAPAAWAAPGLFKKRKKETVETISDYKKFTGRDSVEFKGLMNVICKSDTFFLEIPARLMGREFLVINRLQKVPTELNEAGVNKGINYETQTITFEWDKEQKKVNIRQKRLTPEYAETDAMATSVKNNYIDPLIASFKIDAMATDSSTVIIKVNDLFNGRKTCLNDVFNMINLGTSTVTDLSKIINIKAFDNSVTATSELTTTVHEGLSKINITVEVSTTLALLPETPMTGRAESPKVGYFTTSRLAYSDNQQNITRKNYITRWRLEPKDEFAYISGELSEPVKPIVFYIDNAMPRKLVPYIKQGILDWNVAFERAGFRDAVRVVEYTDSMAAEGDDIGYSLFTYAASEKANAMGPSVIDPRSGEILEADIIWWHNVKSLLRDWIMTQTGAINPAVRTLQLPDSIIGDAARFVACHEVGHSLGLRHNMRASNAYPTDSLRSRAFTERVGGTSASIMDYARFNYVAQPEDNISVTSPHIGPYDLLAIEWGYRWFTDEKRAAKELEQLLKKHSDRVYRYSEAQSTRLATDPRALSEDLGDDAVKSATYGIENLKRIVPNVIEWTTTGEPGQTYDEAAKFYKAIISQWSLYHYHVLANIGGIYLENVTVGDGTKAFTYVEKERQKEAAQFLINEVIDFPEWLFNNKLFDYTYLLQNTPLGVFEQHPYMVYKNQLNYIFWDLLANERIMRMLENEAANGKQAFTAAEMINMLHKHIFATTIAGRTPDAMQRNAQKSFVDALITAASEKEGVKINSKLYDEHPILDNHHTFCGCREQALSSAPRTLIMANTQINRNSDVISLKRGELIKIMKLLKSRLNGADDAARLHYEDIILRIQTGLGLNK